MNGSCANDVITHLLPLAAALDVILMATATCAEM